MQDSKIVATVASKAEANALSNISGLIFANKKVWRTLIYMDHMNLWFSTTSYRFLLLRSSRQLEAGNSKQTVQETVTLSIGIILNNSSKRTQQLRIQLINTPSQFTFSSSALLRSTITDYWPNWTSSPIHHAVYHTYFVISCIHVIWCVIYFNCVCYVFML